MKKLSLFALLLILGATAAQAQVDLKAGFTKGFENRYGGGGLNVGAVFAVSEDIDLAPSLSFFFPDDYRRGGYVYDYDLWMIDLDGHYNVRIEDVESLKLYGLLGLNLTTLSLDVEGPGFGEDYDDSSSELGLNVGIGAKYDFAGGPLGAYTELKYIAGDADQGVFTIGLTYRIK